LIQNFDCLSFGSVRSFVTRQLVQRPYSCVLAIAAVAFVAFKLLEQTLSCKASPLLSPGPAAAAPFLGPSAVSSQAKVPNMLSKGVPSYPGVIIQSIQTYKEAKDSGSDNLKVLEEAVYQSMREHIPKMSQEWSQNTSCKNQLEAHDCAKKFLRKAFDILGIEIHFISPPESNKGESEESMRSEKAEDSVSEFASTQITRGVQADIIRSGQNVSEEEIDTYTIAGQFNNEEQTNRESQFPGDAAEALKSDCTQGPQGQLAFDRMQIEVLHAAGNLGYNALIPAISKAENCNDLRSAFCNGYLSPISKEQSKDLTEILTKHASSIEYTCIYNTPRGGTKKVGMFLTAAPALGNYLTEAGGMGSVTSVL